MNPRLGHWNPLPRSIEILIGAFALLLFVCYLLFLPFYRAGQKIREWVWSELRWPG